MKPGYKIALMLIAATITIIGFITGKFIFLFILLPLGFLFNHKNKKE